MFLLLPPLLRVSTTLSLPVLTLANHLLWFDHFASISPYTFPITAVSSFFLVCVWLAPFLYFISLSAGDYMLPSSRDRLDAGVSGASGANASTSAIGGGFNSDGDGALHKKGRRLGNVVKTWLGAALKLVRKEEWAGVGGIGRGSGGAFDAYESKLY